MSTAEPLPDRSELAQEGPTRWRLEPHGQMRVPGIVFASRELLEAEGTEQALRQVANVATLPGIVVASFAMPDVHWGYGFPIGGVAATDVERGGVVSPGGVGFDISCGVRLLVSDLSRDELVPHTDALMDALGAHVPRGVGRGGIWPLRDEGELRAVLTGGAGFIVQHGHGEANDLERCEDHGAVGGVDVDAVSHSAMHRGRMQLGSLGAGNHFLEIQVVDDVSDAGLASAFGLEPGRVCVMIHTGSRGLGHQICTDHIEIMKRAMSRLAIRVPDAQLACVPVESDEGHAYMGAMAAAANYGRANRQVLSEAARDAFAVATGSRRLRLLYDVSHNLAKLEVHEVDGRSRTVCVQRKGATRALPPGHPDLPEDLRDTGQPVLIPGSMGTASHVLAGVPGAGAFASAAHGAGRTMSRHAAAKRIRGSELRDEMQAQGIAVRPGSARGLAEEAPFAYKDVDEVVRVCEDEGLGRRVARLRPLGVVKG